VKHCAAVAPYIYLFLENPRQPLTFYYIPLNQDSLLIRHNFLHQVQFILYSVLNCIFGVFFGFLRQAEKWSEDEGFTQADSTFFGPIKTSHEFWLGPATCLESFLVLNAISSFRFRGLRASPANLSNLVRGVRVM